MLQNTKWRVFSLRLKVDTIWLDVTFYGMLIPNTQADEKECPPAKKDVRPDTNRADWKTTTVALGYDDIPE